MEFLIIPHLSIVLIAMLTYFGELIETKASFARGEDGDDQSKCFNNLLFNLPTESFSASSVWENRPEFKAHQARMSTIVDSSSNNNGEAWCSNSSVSAKPIEWLEINLGDLKLISNFFTMGRGEGNFKEFMEFFLMEYQRETNQWIRYKNEQSKELMIGNGDSRNIARTKFDSLIVARKIRIYPIGKESSKRPCFRIGIYGCDYEDGVVEYSMPQGHLYTINANEKYDFRDLSYDGDTFIDHSKHSQQLYKGMGQLIDNVIYNGTIQNEKNSNTRGFHFVGWNKNIIQSDEIKIIMKLDQIRQLKEIRLYALNMISNGIGVFASVKIHFSIGGEIYDSFYPPCFYKTNINRRLYHSHWIDIPLKGVLTRYITLHLVFDIEWIVISEIILISKKSYIDLPNEKGLPKKKTDSVTSIYNISTVFKYSTKNQTTNKTNKSKESSLNSHSNIGLIVILASCFLGLSFLLILIIFGSISIGRNHKRSKRKFRYPNYPRTNCGPLIADSLVVPLTDTIHSSPGTDAVNFKRPRDLGISYPIMGKEYMTLSSKSGTDYDMAGSNSLDGLLPIYKDIRYSSHLSQNTSSDNPYVIPTYSRYSNNDSLGSSYTEYATTSLHNFPQILENNSNIVTCFKPGLNNSNFQLQGVNQDLPFLNTLPKIVQNTSSSLQFFESHQDIEKFPRYSPYRNVFNLNNGSPMQSSRFQNALHYNMLPYPYLVSEYNFNTSPAMSRKNALPPLQGIFGNSTIISTDDVFRQSLNSISLTNILSSLVEIDQGEIEDISVVGKGEHGVIGIVQTIKKDYMDKYNMPTATTYLSKSLSNYLSIDIRNAIVQEMGVLLNIKHSAFLQLSSYAFNHRNSLSMKQLTMCFLFKIDEQMENLHTFLQRYSSIRPTAQNIPKTDISHTPNLSSIQETSKLEVQLYPNIPSLVYICCQIAKGMHYLEIHKIVHRDLAARNCLISSTLTVKITDIAMSNPHFKDHYIECTSMEMKVEESSRAGSSLSVVKMNYPLKWMAFETILQGWYTIKTDIWSFGVTMWEILTRCKRSPFGDFVITIDQLIENANYLRIGNHEAIFPCSILSKTEHLPNDHEIKSNDDVDISSSIFDTNFCFSSDFSNLIKECWHRNPFQRPTFENISLFLEQKISNFKKESSDICL